MQIDISQQLNAFSPISLEEMDRVKLLDRTDTKFIFNYNLLPAILGELCEYYQLLNVKGINQNRYETLYFDTPAFKLYFDHHNGRINRYKVRYRKYVDSDLVFFEVKYKNNKGRTIKSRVKRKNIHQVIEGKSSELIYQKTPLNPENLQSKLWVNYSRITLVNKCTTERLTLDTNLCLKKDEKEIGFNNLVIAEVKQEKLGASPFLNVMKMNHLREGSISKYCFGVISLIDSIKKNNFKSHLLTVNKLSYEPGFSSCN
jgi:hypothetical protein